MRRKHNYRIFYWDTVLIIFTILLSIKHASGASVYRRSPLGSDWESASDEVNIIYNPGNTTIIFVSVTGGWYYWIKAPEENITIEANGTLSSRYFYIYICDGGSQYTGPTYGAEGAIDINGIELALTNARIMGAWIYGNGNNVNLKYSGATEDAGSISITINGYLTGNWNLTKLHSSGIRAKYGIIGNLTITGPTSGNVDTWNGSSYSSITGNVTINDFSGNICASNITPNDIPTNIQITPECSTWTVCGQQVPCETEITSHPQNQIILEGGTAFFSVTATGTNLIYQWQYDDYAGGSGFVDLSDDDDITGATSDTLQIANVEGFDEGDYRCRVTGSGGTVYSNSASLTVLPPRRLYVDSSSSGGNGSSWSNAYNNLQAALIESKSAIDVTEIWVAVGVGVYKPTTDTDRSVSFELVDGVTIYGGFVGGETDLAQRDPQNNETILSGDIGAVDDDSDNSYHVVTGGALMRRRLSTALPLLAVKLITPATCINKGAGGCTTIQAAPL